MTDVLARPRDPAPPPEPTKATTGGGWFRAFWRWHFFASFLVVPILLMLAVTGLIYLFRFQLEPLLHADLMKVDPEGGTGQLQPYSTQEALVIQAYPDAEIVSMAEPREEGRSTVFSVVTGDGEARDVYVDPYTPEVLGSMNPDTTLSGTAVRLHGELMAGPWGDHVIELAACWAIVMALTGYVLFVKRLAGPAQGSSVRSACGEAEIAARHGRLGRRHRPALPGRLRPAVDRLLGREGADLRHRARLVHVERRPGRVVRPDLDARRVAAARPQDRRALGAG